MRRFGSLVAACVWLLVFEAKNSIALFEDQAFKFDWLTPFVGVVEHADFWEAAHGRDAALLCVATRSNVVAALDSDSGLVRWRQVLNEDILGLGVGSKHLATVSISTASAEEGHAGYFLRLWSPSSGALVGERLVQVPEESEAAATAFTVDSSNGQEAYLVWTDENGGVRVRVFDFVRDESRVSSFTTGSGERVTCGRTLDAFLCLAADSSMLYYTALPLPKDKNAGFSAVQLSQLGLTPEFQPLRLETASLAKHKAYVRVRSVDSSEEALLLKAQNGKVVGSHLFKSSAGKHTAFLAGCKHSDDLFLIQQTCADESCRELEPAVKASRIGDQGQAVTHEMNFKYPSTALRVSKAWVICDSQSSDPKESAAAFQLVLQADDGSLTSLTPNSNVMWTREEALADIKLMKLVSSPLQEEDDDEGPLYNDSDAPLNDHELAATAAKHHSNVSPLNRFFRRIRHHLALVHSTFRHLLNNFQNLDGLFSAQDTSYDDFGLRKMLVAVTGTGKVLGVDSKSGDVRWHLRFSGEDSSAEPLLHLFVQRPPTHFGLDARAALVYRNKFSGLPELLTFDPLSGKLHEKKVLRKDLSQVVLLHHINDEHVRPLLLLGKNSDSAQTEPKITDADYLSALAQKSFVVRIKRSSVSDSLEGTRLSASTSDMGLHLAPTWSLTVPGCRILQILSKDSDEKVHSHGRVMADRSVLFKYLNPNLALVLAEGGETNKNVLEVLLVDLVTGRVVFSAHHKRVTGPYFAVHSENWAVYTYYNEKARRAELTSLELFEGSSQSNASVFSSLSNTVQPLVERQAFILGQAVTNVGAMRDTVTEKGITSKHVLMASAGTGAVFEVPRHLLDPRRPNINTPPDLREPGLPPYIPELQLPPEAVLNYNQSVLMPRDLVTAPTGLESTSVVVVYGLDLYCTRVTPSKGFDLIKEDFDYYVIASVLMALVIASVATKKLSQRKNLKIAWR